MLKICYCYQRSVFYSQDSLRTNFHIHLNLILSTVLFDVQTPIASQGQVRDTLAQTSSASPSSALANAPRYPLHSGAEAATAVYTAAAALTALQQQQNRLATPKHQSSSVSPRSTTVGSTSVREGQPHRGRGRPPKSSISMTKVEEL